MFRYYTMIIKLNLSDLLFHVIQFKGVGTKTNRPKEYFHMNHWVVLNEDKFTSEPSHVHWQLKSLSKSMNCLRCGASPLKDSEKYQTLTTVAVWIVAPWSIGKNDLLLPPKHEIPAQNQSHAPGCYWWAPHTEPLCFNVKSCCRWKRLLWKTSVRVSHPQEMLWADIHNIALEFCFYWKKSRANHVGETCTSTWVHR